MASEQQKTGGVGGRLRAARERKGISIRKISEATKISSAFLEALEKNDIKRLPGGIFSRSFVRTYAIEVGLPPEEIVEEFIAQFPNDPVAAGRPTIEQHDDNENVESNRRLASALLMMGGISIPIVIGVLYFGLAGRRPADHRSPTAAPSGAAAPKRGSSSGSVADSSQQGFVVGVAASSPTRVSASIDGQPGVDRDLRAGEHVDLKVAREIVLAANDAGAVTLTLDGAPGKPLGEPGSAATVRLDTTNFRNYLAGR
jgi:cytoskeletal protein RodZ